MHVLLLAVPKKVNTGDTMRDEFIIYNEYIIFIITNIL